METPKSSFDHLWELLDPPAGYLNMRAKCESVLWDACSLPMKRRIYRLIRHRKRTGEPVNPNPWFAIVNARDAEPFNYNGSPDVERMAQSVPIVVAWYKGRAGLYTLEEAQALHMQIIRLFN